MKPIVLGARGPAVEDIQRRLLILGYELGPTGVDGVFLGKTYEAVRAFQRKLDLSDDGVVGPETWSALVDSTFALGDRMLYLRLPYFHGNDVRTLQKALNVLGFATGDADGIFGAFSERAVREFQRSCGQLADGIVGPETVRALLGLKHIWEGKDSSVPYVQLLPARSIDPLLRYTVGIDPEGAVAQDVADRLVNLAQASDPRVQIKCLDVSEGGAEVIVSLMDCVPVQPVGLAVTALGDDDPAAFSSRLLTAFLALADSACRRVIVDLAGVTDDEAGRQRAAVRLLDGLCAALA